MKKLTAPRTTQQRLHCDALPALKQEAADQRTWTGCTGGEFSLDCPFCWSPEPSRQRNVADGLC
ncbi:hypothetical protein [Pseudarthrobacter sp. N5]|uniref:hypothetical protein n=1 Tax=Pseudarthrobacter sp. N5 TaxID=3418416 RepID=UPI003CE87526